MKQEFVSYQIALRALGGICFVFGLIESILGFVVYFSFADVHFGGWWGATLPVISGVLATASFNKCFVIGACIVSAFGIVIAVIAALVDGGASIVTGSYTACCSGDGNCWGSDNGVTLATLCAAFLIDTTASPSSCFCTDESSLYSCAQYKLNSGNNCDVFAKYSTELHASSILLWFTAFSLLALSIATCCSLCCGTSMPTVKLDETSGVSEVLLGREFTAIPQDEEADASHVQMTEIQH